MLGKKFLKHSETIKSKTQHQEKQNDKNVDDLSTVNTIPPETIGRTSDQFHQVCGVCYRKYLRDIFCIHSNLQLVV